MLSEKVVGGSTPWRHLKWTNEEKPVELDCARE